MIRTEELEDYYTMYVFYNTFTNTFFRLSDNIPASEKPSHVWDDIDEPLIPVPLDRLEAFIGNVLKRLGVDLMRDEILLVPMIVTGEPYFEGSFPITELKV